MTVIRKLAAAILFGMVLNSLIISKAKAASFTFKKIVDPSSSPFGGPMSDLFSPAINDSGTVAFQAANGRGEGIFTSSGGSFTTIADTVNSSFGMIFSPSINNSGTVAFQAGLKGGTLNGVGPGVGIYTGSGGSLTTISFDTNAGGILVSRPSINDSGTVAFVDNKSGVTYTGNGGPRTFIANTAGGSPFINNQGTVSFVLPGASLVTRNREVTTTIADTRNSFSSLFGNGSPVNNNGIVAFEADLKSGGEGIFTGNGKSVTTIADTSDSFSGFSTPAINDEGTVAFEAGLKGSGGGIFTGSDPIADKVIANGDSLFGSTVTFVDITNPQSLNNLGQIAFVAALADGTRSIYVATPVPEPSTITGSGLALAGLGLFKRRQQKLRKKAN